MMVWLILAFALYGIVSSIADVQKRKEDEE